MPRMRILNADEQVRLEHPPVFNSAERKRFFDFSKSIMDAAHDLRSTANRIGFLLAYGYFLAARRFFSPERHHERAIAFVSRVIGASPYEFSKENYRERTRLNHQKRILDLQGFRPFGTWAADQLITEIAKMARVHLKPRLIFGRCIDFLIEKRIQLPGARRLTDLIRARLSEQKEDLIRLVDMNLSPDLRVLLDDLFEQEDGENRYRLTLLSKISQSTRPGKIRKTAADLEILAHLYGKIAPVFEVLDIGSEGVRYYAGGVHRGSMFQLQRRADADRHLHAIAFIADQNHRLQDAMVDMLLSVMQSFRTTVEREHRDAMFEQRRTIGARLEKMLDGVESEVSDPRHESRAPFAHETMPDTWKLDSIVAVPPVATWKASSMSLRAGFRKSATADESLFLDILKDRSIRLQNRISPNLKQNARHVIPFRWAIRRTATIGAAARLPYASRRFRDTLHLRHVSDEIRRQWSRRTGRCAV